MTNPFFDHPILNSPYQPPLRHWELDDDGQPTQKTLETRRPAKFITPIPKPKKRKSAAKQDSFVFDDGAGLSTEEQQGDTEKRAGIFIGPEFGTVQRSDLVEAARECGDAGFDVLIACAFNYEAHATEFSKLGRIKLRVIEILEGTKPAFVNRQRKYGF